MKNQIFNQMREIEIGLLFFFFLTGKLVYLTGTVPYPIQYPILIGRMVDTRNP